MTLILKATRTHAQNLAKYAAVYKFTMLALKHMGSTPGKESPYDAFFAGLLGGYLVFGRRSKKGHVSSVSKQICIFGTSPRLLRYCGRGANRFSFCESYAGSRTALNRTAGRHNKISAAFEKDLTRRMAGVCGADVGKYDVVI